MKEAEGIEKEGDALDETKVLDRIHAKFTPAQLAEMEEGEAVARMRQVLTNPRGDTTPRARTLERDAPESTSLTQTRSPRSTSFASSPSAFISLETSGAAASCARCSQKSARVNAAETPEANGATSRPSDETSSGRRPPGLGRADGERRDDEKRR